MMQPELNAPRDIRYQCLMTALAILLFLPVLFLLGLGPRVLQMASNFGMEVPSLTRIVATSPVVTLLVFVGLLISTIIFAWSNHKGAILASVSLLFQGLALGIVFLSILMVWTQLLNGLVQ